MSSGLKWRGEEVNKGDPLFVIMTDKAAIEVEFLQLKGILSGVKAKPDDVLPVTEVIGYILDPGEALPIKGAPLPIVIISAASTASAKIETAIEREEGVSSKPTKSDESASDSCCAPPG